MDDIARYNKERWEDLARSNILYSRPYLNLTPEAALQVIDPYHMLGEIAGKDVLALASGGGQQSAAFAMLGAHVTVFDLSETQLERDRAALAHHKLEARIEQGDMRDLSRFPDDSFDIVYHAFSLNFVPDVNPVFDEVTRVLRPGGIYRLEWTNPFKAGTFTEDWNGTGYVVGKQLYADGELIFTDPNWTWFDEDGEAHRIKGPREFNHKLSTVVNGLIARGFQITGLREQESADLNAAPGTWEHFVAHLPPWISVWARYSG